VHECPAAGHVPQGQADPDLRGGRQRDYVLLHTIAADPQDRRLEIIDGLSQLDKHIRTVLELNSQVQELAKELYQHKSLLIMGRGFNFATCLEGALVRIWILGACMG